MGRYFPEDGKQEAGGKEEVFTINDTAIEKAKARVFHKPKRKHGNKSYRKMKKGADPFSGKKPEDAASLERHARGEGDDTAKVTTKFKQMVEQARREHRIEFAAAQAARAEMLLQEELGLLERDK